MAERPTIRAELVEIVRAIERYTARFRQAPLRWYVSYPEMAALCDWYGIPVGPAWQRGMTFLGVRLLGRSSAKLDALLDPGAQVIPGSKSPYPPQ